MVNLLDTSTLLWNLAEPEKLTKPAREAVASGEVTLCVASYHTEFRSAIELGACPKLLSCFPAWRIPMFAPVSSGRLPELTLECTIEGRFGLVSNLDGDLRHASRCLFE